MSRNRDRVAGTKKPDTSAPAPLQQDDAGGFSFVVPTEFIDLPSRGRFYPENHPLRGQDTIEIKQMTAKEEDMLTSKSLLKKGVALERVISSVIVDRRINPAHLLVGDRNAIIIASRVSAYGNLYDTKVQCPACTETQRYCFDLNETPVIESEADGGELLVTDNKDGTFTTELPRTKLLVTFSLLTGISEKRVLDGLEADRKTRNQHERGVTRQLRGMIAAVNGNSTSEAIDYTVNNIPSADSRHLRLAYKQASPDVDMTRYFECEACGHEERMEVPLTADFFWPDR